MLTSSSPQQLATLSLGIRQCARRPVQAAQLKLLRAAAAAAQPSQRPSAARSSSICPRAPPFFT